MPEENNKKKAKNHSKGVKKEAEGKAKKGKKKHKEKKSAAGNVSEDGRGSAISNGPFKAWQQEDLVTVDLETSPEPQEITHPGSTLKQIPGYEMVTDFGGSYLLQPPSPQKPPSGKPPVMDFVKMDDLSEDLCRSSMLEFVGQHCCYGAAAARTMTITRIEPTSALHYILESFTESRSAGYGYKPYSGGPVDGPENGKASKPWEIPCLPAALFTDETKVVEVPHTSFVMTCHSCEGVGVVRCDRCFGRTYVRCSNCHGRGQVTMRGHQTKERCPACRGDGRKKCQRCFGIGRIDCRVCQAYCKLKCYIQLTVTFTNRQDDYILEETDMPDELIRDVSGGTVLEQIMDQVWPITKYSVSEINNNSARLVEKHREAFPGDRLYKQRHQLRVVPVTEVHYEWKSVRTRYWIYGKEHKVYAPDYPQKCCWGCNIL